MMTMKVEIEYVPVPDEEFEEIKKNCTRIMTEEIAKIFCSYMNIIRDKKFLSEILEIKPTKNIMLLFDAFAEQYGELWFCTDERRNELMNRLDERTLFVLDKHMTSKVET